MYFKNIKNKTELKKQFRELTKKYHPDNLETGDGNVFLQIKKEYDELSKKYPTIKRIKITLGYNYCLTGTEIKVGDYVIKIPKNYNKVKSKFYKIDEKFKIKYIITLEIVSTNDYIVKSKKNIIIPTRILYVSLDDLKNGKVEVDGKILTIPFNGGKMYDMVNGVKTELRLKNI